mgnify:FL=1
MKKIISSLLICMLAAVCLFTGCSKAKGLKVKDSSGNDRVLVTDENGKPIYDEAGNIVVVDTDEKGNAKKDENGEQATNAIALDYLLVSGKNAYCRYFTFTQPSGYDMSAVGSAITLTKGDETIDIIYDTEKSIADKRSDLSEIIASIKEQGYNPEVKDETKTLCGQEAKVTEIKISSKDYEAFLVCALFEKDGVIYTCNYQSPKANASTGDFESIVNSISFR